MSSPDVKRRKLNGSSSQSNAPTDAPIQHSQQERSRQNQSTQDAPAELALASGLYKSNLFKLQADELLSQLRPDHDKQLSRVEKPLRRLKEIIESIPEIGPKTVQEAVKYLRQNSSVHIPFPEPRPATDAKYMLQYVKPSHINVVGSFALRTQTRAKKADNYIDLAINIPNEIFQKKDYVNYRYFYKRAYYIACIAAGIKDSKDSSFKLSYDYQDGNTLRPVLVIAPGPEADEGFLRSKTRIRIITTIDHDLFAISNTHPVSNTIRHANDVVNDRGYLATSVYNGSLRTDAAVVSYLKLLHAATLKCPAFRDACMLGRTWLKQRGFGTSLVHGGFGHFEWAALVALLFEGGGVNGKPVLSPSYSSYQIFKATVQFLASRNLTKPLQLFAAQKLTFPTSDMPVLYDGKRGLNVFYKMTPWSYALLRHESQMTLKMLNDTSSDHFSRIFIIRVDDPLCRFDQVFSVTAPRAVSLSTLGSSNYQQSIYEALKTAFGDRVRLLSLFAEEARPWSLQEDCAKGVQSATCVTVAVLLDSHNASRLVDHGPSPDDKEAAAKFREFWGDKAELRRFKDGSIMESLVWSDQGQSVSIVQQIASYILPRHLKPDPTSIGFISDNIGQDLCKQVDFSSSLDSFKPFMDAFADIERILQDLDELPLKFRHLAPCSPFLRYTSINPTLKPGASSPIDLNLEFEGSNRWPDDLAAVQITKLAFLLKVGELMEASHGVLACRVGTENEGSKILNTSYLDVIHTNQATFRIRIYHEREQILLERQLKDKDLSGKFREELVTALAAHKRFFVQAPRHTLAIKTLCTRYPLLSPTIRIFKRWVGSHLLSHYLRDELLELLVAQVFMSSYPWTPPANAITGFFRTLHFLSRWDWQHEPLIVDLNGELGPEELKDIQTKFEAWRNIDPSMNSVSLSVASNIDPDGVTWTQFAKPPKVVATRLMMLADAAINIVKDKEGSLYMPQLLSSPLTDYDFVLHLSPKLIDMPQRNKQVYKNLIGQADVTDLISTVELVKSFVDELQCLHGNSILLFHDGQKGDVIGGVWNPLAVKERPWGLKVDYSTIPKSTSDAGDVLCPNKAAMLSEIATLGGDLIRAIQVNRP